MAPTTSGTYNYGPLIAEMLEESLELAGVDPAAAGGRHIKGFFRSLRFVLNSQWATLGMRQWQIREMQSHTLAVGETSFNLPLGGLDIANAVLRRQATGSTFSDVEMYAITRQEYATITNKFIQGRPDRYFVDRQGGPPVTINNVVYSPVKVIYWQAGSNTTDQIVYDLFQQNQDVAGNLSDTLDLPTHAWDALCLGIAARLALKWNPQKYAALDELYRGPAPVDSLNPRGALGAMRAEDRERGDIDLYPAFEPRTGRR